MPDIEMPEDSILQHFTHTQNGQQAYFSIIDLNYAFSRLQLHKVTAKQCNFNIVLEDLQVQTDLKQLRSHCYASLISKSNELHKCNSPKHILFPRRHHNS